jgi:hypothetical protein
LKALRPDSTRRHLLQTLIATLALMVGLPRVAPKAQVGEGRQAIAELLGRRFSDKAALVAVANVYLAAHPEEADANRLQRLLFPGSSALSAQAFDNWIVRQISADFRAGNLAVVGGWVLAKSEARLCALASLLMAP